MNFALLPWVALGGALGAMLRLALVTRCGLRPPWGTLLVNMLGSIALGFGMVLESQLPAWLMIGFGTGFCGTLTTFSSFVVETVELGRRRRWMVLLPYFLATSLLAPVVILLALMVD